MNNGSRTGVRKLVILLFLPLLLLMSGLTAHAAEITGTFKFADYGLDPVNPPSRPIAHSKVEIWHRGVFFWNVWDMIGATTTDGAGRMSFIDGRADGTYAVRVFATNYAVVVWPNDVIHTVPFYREPGQPGNVIYREVHSVNDEVDFTFDFTDRWAAQHYNIADAVRHGNSYANARRDPNELTEPIPQVNYQPTDVTMVPASYYNPFFNEVVLHSSVVFDDWTILHEYAHFLEDKISSFAPISSYHPDGCTSSVQTPEHAWMEGFADYFAGAVALSLPAGTLNYGVLTERILTLETPPACNASSGDAVENYVAASLWDLFDALETGEETHDFISQAGRAIFEIFDRELDIYGKWPTIWDFRNAWIARSLDRRALDRILSEYNILPLPLDFQSAEFISQSVPTNMIVGQNYSVSVTMRNIGNTTWSIGHKLGSQDPQDNWNWGTNRVDIPAAVPPMATVTLNFTVTAPSTPGIYNFQWRMVQEWVEWFGDFTPNVYMPVYLPLGVNDLLVSNWTAPANACAGATISIKDTTKNQGNGIADASETCFYFSADQDIDADIDRDYNCRAIPKLGLAFGTSSPLSGTETTYLTLPNVPIRKYYLIAMADDGKVVTESNENNNKKSKAIYIGPDLTVVSIVPSPLKPVTGQWVSITVMVKNSGCPVAGPFRVDFYKDLDTAPAVGQVGDFSCNFSNGLGAGATAKCIRYVRYSSEGEYKMWAQVDTMQQVTEANETNNKKSRLLAVNP